MFCNRDKYRKRNLPIYYFVLSVALTEAFIYQYIYMYIKLVKDKMMDMGLIIFENLMVLGYSVLVLCIGYFVASAFVKINKL